MSKLSDALAAMDKATPGPWEQEYSLIQSEPGNCIICNVHKWGNDDAHDQNATIITAAPDALAWIKEALPWLEIRADELRYEIDAQETLIGPVLSDDCIGTMKSDLARLDALIARAKPEV